MADQDLRDYFHFDQTDLDANRKGRFTDGQRVRVIAQDKASRRTMLIFGIVMVLAALVGPGIAISSAVSHPGLGFFTPYNVAFGLIWPLIWGALGVVFILRAFAKRELKIEQVRGRASIVSRDSWDQDRKFKTVYHELHIGGHMFNVNGDVADVLIQGDPYILYYVGGTDIIVSAEPDGKAA
jgi:hypothetical protein